MSNYDTFYSAVKSGRSTRAFTLVELLVVIVIVGILVGLASVGASKALARANETRDLNAAKTLVASYLLATNDGGGYTLAGYDPNAVAETADHESISGPAAARYPWRLAPYFNYDFKSTTHVNQKNVDLESHYAVSLSPAFGINGYMIGGYLGSDGNPVIPAAEVATSPMQLGSLVIFVSSHLEESGVSVPGNHMVTPPKMAGTQWGSTYSSGMRPTETGNVDFRYGKKAIAAFGDGSVALRTFDELKDMRKWSFQAANQGNPDYVVSKAGGSGRR